MVIVISVALAAFFAAETAYSQENPTAHKADSARLHGARDTKPLGKVDRWSVTPQSSDVRSGSRVIGRDPDPFIRGEIGSDISAFLAAGVPADLTRAALRRVWSSEPTIRDFVGLSENSWDVNAPGAMPGFGPIDKEEVARLVTRLLGEPDATAVAAHPSTTPSQTDKAEAARERTRAGRGNADHPGTGRAGSRIGSTAATARYHQCHQRCDAAREAAPASQHESSSGDQRQMTARLGDGSALRR